MGKFKDFLYSKNDILVALIILLVALVIIAFRVAAIMDYPHKVAQEQSKAVQVEQQEEDKTSEEKK